MVDYISPQKDELTSNYTIINVPRLKLRCEMELYMFVVVLRHL